MSAESLRAQHTRPRELAAQPAGERRRTTVAAPSAEIRALLDRIGGAVLVHLAAEDQRWAARGRRAGHALPRRDGSRKDLLNRFMKRWTSEAISADVAGFGREASDLLGGLAARTDREERELYPLDAAPDGAIRDALVTR